VDVKRANEVVVKQGVNYRGFFVYHDGTELVAEPTASDGENFEIASKNRQALYAAIDELWTHLQGASRFEQGTPVPGWYQAWLNDGADGRIRILDSGKHESIAPSRKWWGLGKILAGALVCVAAFVVMPRLDINQDGSVDTDDLASMVEKVYLAHPPKKSLQHFRWGERVFSVSMHPAPDEDVDFEADDIMLNGVSLKRASLPPANPTMSYVPYTSLR
jgi:hypothetical protein